jgi:FixJ family two-component response regulator
MTRLLNREPEMRLKSDIGQSEPGVFSAALPDPNGAVVCLLDDDSSVLKAQGRLLSSVGWKPELFADPGKFLSYAEAHQPRVVVLDVWMPLMNGLEVQSRLGAISPLTKVIIFTGKDDEKVRATAMDAGACAFFVKPFCDEEFIAAIRRALEPTSAD